MALDNYEDVNEEPINLTNEVVVTPIEKNGGYIYTNAMDIESEIMQGKLNLLFLKDYF